MTDPLGDAKPFGEAFDHYSTPDPIVYDTHDTKVCPENDSSNCSTPTSTVLRSHLNPCFHQPNDHQSTSHTGASLGLVHLRSPRSFTDVSWAIALYLILVGLIAGFFYLYLFDYSLYKEAQEESYISTSNVSRMVLPAILCTSVVLAIYHIGLQTGDVAWRVDDHPTNDVTYIAVFPFVVSVVLGAYYAIAWYIYVQDNKCFNSKSTTDDTVVSCRKMGFDDEDDFWGNSEGT